MANGYQPEITGEMRAYEPSPLGKQRQWLQDMMGGIGSFAAEHDIPFLKALDNQPYTRGVAEELTSLSEFIPGFGDVQGFREGKHMLDEGSPLMGGIMMAASFMPFVPGSKLAGKFGKLQEKIDDLKFDRKREVINLPYDGTPAQRSIDRIDNEIRGLTGQQRKLVEDAPSDQLAPSRQPEQRDVLQRALIPPLTQTGRRTRAPSRQPEQEDMLTRLQNLNVRKPKNR